MIGDINMPIIDKKELREIRKKKFAQVLIKKVKLKCCGIKGSIIIDGSWFMVYGFGKELRKDKCY